MLALDPDLLECRQGATGASASQSRYACVANLVANEVKALRIAHMAHQTKLSDLESMRAKPQGMEMRQ